MTGNVELWEHPKARETYMLLGWRQWADAGSVSSGLPQYLIYHTKARLIGQLRGDSYYLFQFPGTHDLIRPVVKFEAGYPTSLHTPHNEFYYSGNEQKGLVIFIGDEPQLDVENYTKSILYAAMELGVKRIIGLGGVYGELPYDKERLISSTYSLEHLKKEVEELAVNLSDYHGGASIGSYLCKRAGENEIEYISFYAFVPTYDFSHISQIGSSIQIENDYTAWLNIMRRVNYMLQLGLDLSDLEKKSRILQERIKKKVEELEQMAPSSGLSEYFQNLSDEFEEKPFDPLDEIWEDEIRRLLDKFDDEK